MLELQNVNIKSDFSKWLLIGGAVILAYYFIKKA